MDSYKVTFQTWNKVASLYESRFMHLDIYNDTYDSFCRLLPQNAALLEIGCGPGNITQYILSRRPDLKIEAIDVASNMVELARHNNPSAVFQVMDARNIDNIKTKFDAVLAGFCMPYLSKQDSIQFIHNCSKLLSKEGVFYLSLIKGSYADSACVSASTGDKCFIYYYDENFIQEQLRQNQFEIIEAFQKKFERQDGTIEDDLIFIARKS